jgi:hypothetical protein
MSHLLTFYFSEFRILLSRIEAVILERFDQETVYKAIGGLLFLRLVDLL